MSIIKKIEVKGTDSIITTDYGRIYIVSSIEETDKCEVFMEDKEHSLGVVTLFNEVMDLITNVDTAIEHFNKKQQLIANNSTYGAIKPLTTI
ncbi:hypothetical protein [Romboutsia sp.]|uniref:hypothetical protein n=1 Tax=Romboutsia sp. TaxID=1965302 RepID=UPI002C807169|nr:hypothetical protein [Romboutsia sp.]HSQ87528.1 hypothetical protein [Romboutsia sp.]